MGLVGLRDGASSISPRSSVLPRAYLMVSVILNATSVDATRMPISWASDGDTKENGRYVKELVIVL